MNKITICGSMAFLPQIEKLQQQLESWGYTVIAPIWSETELQSGTEKPWYANADTHQLQPIDHVIWEDKKGLILDYFQKVSGADAILVANYDKHGKAGYIGGNVLMEMAIALQQGIPIYVLFPPDETASYAEELYGLRPIVLQGDISQFEAMFQL